MRTQLPELPTLTDVVEIPVSAGAPAVQYGDSGALAQERSPVLSDTSSPSVLEVNEERVAQRVLAELLRQPDLISEQRLREVLTPTLERFIDILIHDARLELAATLREVVAQELARRRGS